MKKRFMIFALSLFMIVCFFLSGCTGLNGVEYNVRYYFSNTSKEQIENSEAKYIIFKNNKSGTIRDNINKFVTGFGTIFYYYNVEFTYTKVDDTTVMITYKKQDCVFDNVSYENNDIGNVSYLFLVSKNVVGISYATGINYYFNEKYLDSIGYFD